MKNILLIGGSAGIGQAICNLTQSDYNVFVASRTAESLAGMNVTHIAFDALSDTLDTSVLPAVIDGFVYCPGSINLRPFRGLKKQRRIRTFQKHGSRFPIERYGLDW